MTTISAGNIPNRVTSTPVDLGKLREDLGSANNRADRITLVKKAISGRSVIPAHGLCSIIHGLLQELKRLGEVILVQIGLRIHYGSPNPPPLASMA